MTIQASEQQLIQVFNLTNYQFEIPSYQRPYAWGEDQVLELIDEDTVNNYQRIYLNKLKDIAILNGSCTLSYRKKARGTHAKGKRGSIFSVFS